MMRTQNSICLTVEFTWGEPLSFHTLQNGIPASQPLGLQKPDPKYFTND
jgi:hypothetical protein